MLEANSLSFRYNHQPTLFHNLSFTIEKGEIVGLIGYSGSGKTTLAKILAGYMKPTEGSLYLNGEKHCPKGVNPVQLVWQHPEKAINPQWHMKKVLSEAGPIDEEILLALGIKESWFKRYPSELSGGELQRFCLARALGTEAEFLIADEMTTMLDAITQAQIWHSMMGLVSERNIGVLAISHDYHLLKTISTRIIDFNQLICKKKE